MLPFPFPFSRFEFTSPLSPEQVEERLKSCVARSPSLAERITFSGEAMLQELDGQDAPLWLVGQVADRRFRLRRYMGSTANSFMPILMGTIRPNAQGSRISVLALPSWYILPFLIVWPTVLLGTSSFVAGHFWLSSLLVLSAPVIVMAFFVSGLVAVRRAFIAYLSAPSSVPGAT